MSPKVLDHFNLGSSTATSSFYLPSVTQQQRCLHREFVILTTLNREHQAHTETDVHRAVRYCRTFDVVSGFQATCKIASRWSQFIINDNAWPFLLYSCDELVQEVFRHFVSSHLAINSAVIAKIVRNRTYNVSFSIPELRLSRCLSL